MEGLTVVLAMACHFTTHKAMRGWAFRSSLPIPIYHALLNPTLVSHRLIMHAPLRRADVQELFFIFHQLSNVTLAQYLYLAIRKECLLVSM